MKLPVDTNHLMQFAWPSTIEAFNALKRANEAEDRRNFQEAIKHYKESEQHLLYAIENYAQGDEVKFVFRSKCTDLRNRIEQLNQYLERQESSKQKEVN